jgi:hypothetical protein
MARTRRLAAVGSHRRRRVPRGITVGVRRAIATPASPSPRKAASHEPAGTNNAPRGGRRNLPATRRIASSDDVRGPPGWTTDQGSCSD